MGQEQSYVAPASVPHARPRHRDKYEDPVHYRDPSCRNSAIDCRNQSDRRDSSDYKRHRVRLSTDSSKSDNSSTESSGYRSGSNSGYEYRSGSERSDYYHVSLFKNDHYKDVNKELYRPVKITKDKRYKLQFLDADKEAEYLSKSSRLQSYLSEEEKAKLKAGPTPAKKSGIRNYTPKILSEEEQRKKLENWI